MGYEMEFCKASRQELIFIAKIVCVMLEKNSLQKSALLVEWSIWRWTSYSFFLLEMLKKRWLFPPGEKL